MPQSSQKKRGRMSVSEHSTRRPRVVRISVGGLYDEYDHEIVFPADDEFAIIYGPNGIGKTRVFEIVHAIQRLDLAQLVSQPFRTAVVEYDTEHHLRVDRRELGDDGPELSFDLNYEGEAIATFSTADLEAKASRRRVMRIGGSVWRPLSLGRWIDESDGEIITAREFRRRYGTTPGSQEDELPEALVEFAQSSPIHRIETQRLSASETQRRRGPFDEDEPEPMTVLRYASDLSRRLSEALARNSRTTQALDRTFPARLLSSDESSLSEDEIRTRYNEQSERRERLTRISLIENEVELPLPERELIPWERIVLTRYLEDTEEKLGTFDDIVKRVTLLEEMLNRRLLRKSVRVSVENGVSISTPGGRVIPLTDLSSGEQHELIMAYDLLFRADRGSLVLIDEPEISLHVAWQRAFMNDMLRICRVSGIRAIIATHSPQIIGKWWDRTQRLGPELEQPGWSEDQ